jgi:hypothetical protein
MASTAWVPPPPTTDIGPLLQMRQEQAALTNATAAAAPAAQPAPLAGLAEVLQQSQRLTPGWVAPDVQQWPVTQILPSQRQDPGGGGGPSGFDDIGFLQPVDLSDWWKRLHEMTPEQKAQLAAVGTRWRLENTGPLQQRARWRLFYSRADRIGALMDATGV